MGLNAPWLFIIFKSGIPLVKFGTVNLEQKVWMLMCLLGKISDRLGRSQARLMSAAVTQGTSDQGFPKSSYRWHGKEGELTHKCFD